MIGIKIHIDPQAYRMNVLLVEVPAEEKQLAWIQTELEAQCIEFTRTPIGDIICNEEGLFIANNPVFQYKIGEDEYQIPGSIMITKGADSKGKTLWFDKNSQEDVVLINQWIKIIEENQLLGLAEG